MIKIIKALSARAFVSVLIVNFLIISAVFSQNASIQSIMCNVSIGDFVWDDTNGNGIQDSGENGMQNVPVQLYKVGESNSLLTTYTNSDGYYYFDCGQFGYGDYLVRFILPNGCAFSPKGQGVNGEKDSDANPSTGYTDPISCNIDGNYYMLDAGMYEYATIGDFVWNDLDHDGYQDSDESGLGDVTVKLYKGNGSYVSETMTNAAGYYQFTYLVEGSYYIEFVLKSGYVFSPHDQGGDNSKDSDANTSTGITTTTTLTPWEIDPTWDAGMYVDNTPAEDCCDTGDKPKVLIIEYTGEDCSATTHSQDPTKVNCDGDPSYDSNVYIIANDNDNPTSGKIWFTGDVGLNETYLLNAANAGASEFGSNTVIHIFAYQGGPLLQKVNFHTSCSQPLTQDDQYGANKIVGILFKNGEDCGDLPGFASIGNYVWNDTNNNGIQDDGSTGIPNVNVELFYSGGGSVGTTSTNSSGYYSFDNLIPGDYYVEFTLPNDYRFSPQDTGGDAVDSDVNPANGQTVITTLSDGENDMTWDAGISSIEDCCDTGDKPKVLIMEYTGEDCSATYSAQDPDKYNCSGDPGFDQSVYIIANDNDNPTSGKIWFTGDVGLNETYLLNAANAGASEFGSNTVIHIFAYQGGPLLQKVNFHTSCSQPLTQDDQYGANKIVGILFKNGEDCGDLPGFASIGNYVWNDTNNNGIQDDGSTGIPNVNVELFYSGGGSVGTTSTNSSGYYSFDNLIPGDYYVEFTLPNDYRFSPQDTGGDAVDSDVNPANGQTVITTLSDGENDMTWDAGISSIEDCCDTGDKPKVLIMEYTGEDCSATYSAQDPDKYNCSGDPGFDQSVYIIANDNDNPTSGKIWFTGDVGLNETYLLNAANAGASEFGSNTVIHIFAYQGGPLLQKVNFHTSCSQPLTQDDQYGANKIVGILFKNGEDCGDLPSEKASIGDFVWYDGNKDGQQNSDGSSVGVDDVKVELFHSNGTLAGTTRTNSSGWYEFTNLTPGEYYLIFSEIPGGYIFTGKDLGGDNNRDSDVNSNGRTDNTTLSAGENDDSWDAGIHEGGGDIPPPTDPTCNTNESLLWENNVTINDCDVTFDVRFVTGQTTQLLIPGPYPSAFNGSVDITVSEAIAWDGYCNRPDTGDQPNERFRVVFKKNGSAVWSSPYTGVSSGDDGIATGVISDEWIGPLGGTVNLPNGADQIILEHWSVANGGSNANSVVPSSVCIGYETVTPKLGSIGDFVWHDTFHSPTHQVDGIQDIGELGIEGVLVQLIVGGSVVDDYTTTSSGFYEFTGLAAGDYTVRVAPSNFAAGGVLEGWYASPQNQGGSDALDSDGNGTETAPFQQVVNLSEGEHDPTIDFGFFYTCGDLTKTGPTSVQAGETITYHFRYENCGDIVHSGGAEVFDDMINPVSPHRIWNYTPVWPGEVKEFDRNYITTEKDCGELTNCAWSIGHTPKPSGYTPDLPNDYDQDCWKLIVICEDLDFGDLPSPYPTLLADDGARHIIDKVTYLGANVDPEIDGFPSAEATGDDTNATDDENGIDFVTLVPGGDLEIEVIVSVDGYLNGWVDFNFDGDFNDALENVATDLFLTAGTHTIFVPAPADPSDDLYSRFRFTSGPNQATSITGLAPNGEIEDYYEEDIPLAVTLSSFTATSNNGQVDLVWVTESEIENQGFVIGRRIDGSGDGWQEIANYATHSTLRGQGTVTYSTTYEFEDRLVQPGLTYEYRLADIDYNGIVTYHSTRTVKVDEFTASFTPKEFTVKPAYPNPFNPSTNIEYAIPNDGLVNINIYDLAGQRVSALVNEEQQSGWHKTRWNGNDDSGIQMPAGVYLVTVNTGNSIKTMKLIYVK